MLELREQYVERFSGDKEYAMVAMVADLMLGDESRFKAGYTEENAVLATAEVFAEERATVQAAVDKWRAT